MNQYLLDSQEIQFSSVQFTNNSIEDEAHFLTECPAYHELRMPLLKLANINSLPTNLQFIQLMRIKSKPVLSALAKFLKNAFEIRNGTSS